MKIKFIKEYCTCFRDEENMVNTETFKPDDMVSTSMEEDRYFTEELARWLINNGFAEEVKESGWWKPMAGDRYYFIDDSGCIKEAIWGYNFWDVDRYKLGNVFKTKKATKRCRDYLEAIATVRQDEGVIDLQGIGEEYEAAPENKYNDFSVYTVAFNLYLRKLVVIDADEYISANAIWFDTEEHAQSSLDNHQDEWKIIANYDWSKE